MGIHTFGKTIFNFREPKINGIQWDNFNGKQLGKFSKRVRGERRLSKIMVRGDRSCSALYYPK